MTCTKRAYISKQEAKRALESTRNSRSERRAEVRFYRCPDCKQYHLTSHAER